MDVNAHFLENDHRLTVTVRKKGGVEKVNVDDYTDRDIWRFHKRSGGGLPCVIISEPLQFQLSRTDVKNQGSVIYRHNISPDLSLHDLNRILSINLSLQILMFNNDFSIVCVKIKIHMSLDVQVYIYMYI